MKNKNIILTLSKKNGFTLIEVMIAITILTTLMILTTKSLQNALTSKEKMENKIRNFALIRNAINLIKKDVTLAFHYVDFDKEIWEEAKKEIEKENKTKLDKTKKNKTSYLNSQSPEKINTQFVGSDNEFHFISKNIAHVYAEIKTGNYQEISYYTKKCRNMENPKYSSNCLYRRTSRWVDEKIEEGGDESVLLENIKDFQIKYYNQYEDKWINSWDSIKSTNYPDLKNHYPYFVYISFIKMYSFEKEKPQVNIEQLIPIHFPNNPKNDQDDKDKGILE